jgi:hypothetical protein
MPPTDHASREGSTGRVAAKETLFVTLVAIIRERAPRSGASHGIDLELL